MKNEIKLCKTIRVYQAIKMEISFCFMYTHTPISVEVLLLGTKISWVLLLGTFFFRTIPNDFSWN